MRSLNLLTLFLYHSLNKFFFFFSSHTTSWTHTTSHHACLRCRCHTAETAACCCAKLPKTNPNRTSLRYEAESVGWARQPCSLVAMRRAATGVWTLDRCRYGPLVCIGIIDSLMPKKA